MFSVLVSQKVIFIRAVGFRVIVHIKLEYQIKLAKFHHDAQTALNSFSRDILMSSFQHSLSGN